MTKFIVTIILLQIFISTEIFLILILFIFHIFSKIEWNYYQKNDSITFFFLLITIFLFIKIFLFKFSLTLFSIFIIVHFLLIKIFTTNNFFLIYLYFEFSIFPIIIIIIFDRNSIEKIKASIWIFIYTFVLAIPFFFYLAKIEGFLIIRTFFIFFNSWRNYLIVWIIIVKIPIFILHFWLPKAHVESSIYGSIILAALILKVGGYLIIRWIDIIYNLSKFFFFISNLRIFGSIILSIYCLSISDFKIIIAYSSIAHINLIIPNINIFRKISIFSRIILFVSHAFISSVFFYSLNLSYENFKTKRNLFSKGINFRFRIILIIFLITISNFGFPPLISFFSEILILSNIIIFFKKYFFILIILIYLFSLYRINFFFNLISGKTKSYFKYFITNLYICLISCWIFSSIYIFILFN